MYDICVGIYTYIHKLISIYHIHDDDIYAYIKRYTLPLAGHRTLSFEIAWKQWKFMHFKYTAFVYLTENLIKPCENEDIWRGRQVFICVFERKTL